MLRKGESMDWKIGCSGYFYPEWKGYFYPFDLATNKWFEFYCEHFNTIELNTTYYRFPRVESLLNWYKRSPAEFTFSVKAPRALTHFKKLKNPVKYLADFYANIRKGLSEKLGGVLYQFPSSFHASEEHIEQILSMLDHSFRNVVEFRHSSWWDSSIIKTLNEHQITFAGISHPEFSNQLPDMGDVLYYRLQGVPHVYQSTYDKTFLKELNRKISKRTDAKAIYIYFNNAASGAALDNARQLRELAMSLTSI
jgi:uncharacterized protein YecE (DUF72 family)